MTINERIKHLRKDILEVTQKDFGEKLGIWSTTVSAFERGGGVADSTIKSICMAYNVREEWLRTGDGDVFNEPRTFSLDDFLKERGASPLEVDFMKAYFDLDEQTRRQLIENFKARRAESARQEARDDIERELDDYRRQLLAEKKAAGASSASPDTPAAGNKSRTA